MVRKPDGGKPSISRTRELLHRRLKQRCSGGGTPKQPTHHVPFCFGEYMCMYIIQGVRRAEAMGRPQMPPLSLWLKGSETEPNAKSVPTSSHRNSFTRLCDHDQGKSCAAHDVPSSSRMLTRSTEQMDLRSQARRGLELSPSAATCCKRRF